MQMKSQVQPGDRQQSPCLRTVSEDSPAGLGQVSAPSALHLGSLAADSRGSRSPFWVVATSPCVRQGNTVTLWS